MFMLHKGQNFVLTQRFFFVYQLHRLQAMPKYKLQIRRISVRGVYAVMSQGRKQCTVLAEERMVMTGMCKDKCDMDRATFKDFAPFATQSHTQILEDIGQERHPVGPYSMTEAMKVIKIKIYLEFTTLF